MYAEARDSANAVAAMLRENKVAIKRIGDYLRRVHPQVVATIARGSSDNACTFGRYLIECGLGFTTTSLGLSVGSVYGAPADMSGQVCFAVSQSGASPDLLSAVRRARTGGAFIIGLINQPEAPLASLCHEVVSLQATPERSVAATKSFIASLAAFAAIFAEWAEDPILRRAVDDIPTLLGRAWEEDWSAMNAVLHNAVNLFVLGRGPGLGIAQEAALKLKETCDLHAEAFSAAEVLHGPLALVKAGFPIVAFAQADASFSTSRAIAEGMAGREAAVLFAGGDAAGTICLATQRAHPVVEPILMAQSFYRAAANLSIERGRDPDRPPHLSKVTRTH